MHPLKIACLSSWGALCAFQLGLLWPGLDVELYWVALLCLPLLAPLDGLLRDRLYTYKWVGFLTLAYFCIGVSELAASPELRIYAVGTTLASLLLFLASIYYVRYLARGPAG